tara:strand:+ start:36 stop:413 length:378 start_codon:yes stop_codon:yes gene_type:complete
MIDREIIEHAIFGVEQLQEGCPKDEIHNRLFNEDYFIIGYYNAEKFLTKENGSVFRALEIIRDYELEHLGEITTDFSNSEKVANMYAYIKGEELLNSCNTLKDTEGNITDEEITELLIELTHFFK